MNNFESTVKGIFREKWMVDVFERVAKLPVQDRQVLISNFASIPRQMSDATDTECFVDKMSQSRLERAHFLSQNFQLGLSSTELAFCFLISRYVRCIFSR